MAAERDDATPRILATMDDRVGRTILTLALAASCAAPVGCRRRDAGVDAATTSTGTSGSDVALSRGSIASGGHTRTFAYFVPADAPKPLPLVIALHGRLGDGAGQDRLSHLSTIAAREKFVLALPDGYSRSWNDARHATPAAKDGYDDVAFLGDLITWLVANTGADPSRVYLTGMSNGGFMAATAACALADRVAAFAIVGSTFPGGLEATCKPSRAMPAMVVMGDRDPLVPYAGGGLGRNAERGTALSAIDAARFWATTNGCAPASTASALPDTDPDDGTRTNVTRFTGCRDGADVSLFTVEGGGHTWPGGLQYLGERMIGKTSRDWDASAVIWAFFAGKRR